ncbi:MAG: hypothetical protein K8U57_19750 [Planctomycetes bacterium]|nr:hypothetical protein [Planctomycetota bacterium]
MMLFTRVEARDFKTLLSRCVSGRPRGPAPSLVIQFENGQRTIAATTTDGVTLTHVSRTPGAADDRLVLPVTVLAEVEGSTSEAVTLERQSKLRAVVRWPAGGKPRTLPVELILPGKQHALAEQAALTSVSGGILSALQECGRSAARDSGRYALAKVQIQGKAGRVAGTDGKVALLWGGFKFPFADNILVPALSVFGSKPLADAGDVRMDRTATHLTVATGPWSVTLPTDATSRYPDIAGVIPRDTPTVATLDEKDATELLPVLPTLPGNDHENRPVTLDADGSVTIRSSDPNTAGTKDVPLTRSSSIGPPARVALDRRILARALSLGCRTFRLTPGKLVIGERDGLTFIAALLEPDLIVSPPADLPKATTGKPIAHSPQERNPTMARPETNGHAAPRDDPQDPLLAAEDLRAALVEAATKATKLVSALKVGRKEKKVLATVFAGLKQLNLNVPNGQP